MSRSKSVRFVPLSLLLAAVAIACSDSRPVSPIDGADPLAGRVLLQSPDTSIRGGEGTPPAPPVTGDGLFRGVVRGYSEADFPDTLRSAKPLANVVVTVYPATLTDGQPELGPEAARVVTNTAGEFTTPTLTGGLYVVTFTPPEGESYDNAWTLATAHSQSGERPWIIMLRER